VSQHRGKAQAPDAVLGMVWKSAQEPIAVPKFYVVPVNKLLCLFAVISAFNECGRAENVPVI
jgi:hypothetical protein